MRKGLDGFDVKDATKNQDMANRIAELERQLEALQSEKEKADKALRESRYRSRKLLETIPDLMFVLSRDGRILDYQANDDADLAVEKGRMVGSLLSESMPPEVVDDTLRAIEAALRQNRLQLIEYQLPEQDHLRDYEARIAPLSADSVLAIVRNITPQKRSERYLRRSERKFRKLYEQAPIGIFRTNLQGKALSVNSTMARMLGFDAPEEAVAFYTNLGEQLYADPAVREEFIRRLQSEGHVENFEYRARTREGQSIWLSMNARVVPSVRSGEVAIEGFTTDISDRKRAEENLQGALQRQNEAVRAGNVGLWDWNPENDEVHYSTEWKRQIGYEDGEIDNDVTEWLSRVHPDDLEPTIAIIRNTLVEDSPRQAEFRFRHKDGSYRWILARASTLQDKFGNPTRLFGSNIDITERKRAEEDLRRTMQDQKELKTQLAHAVEIANSGHWEYDVVKDLFHFNDQFYRLFGTTAEAVGGYSMSADTYAQRFVHPEDQHLVRGEIKKAIATTDPAFKGQIEHRILYADGSVGHFLVLFFVRKDSAGKTVRTYGVNQDITERKTIEARLLQAQKMESIGNLAGGIAHDFNNILFPIVGLAEMLMEDLPPKSLERESVREIYEAGRRGAELVKQILTFSRQSEQKLLPIYIQKILKEFLQLCTATIPSDIAITSNVQQDCGSVMANPTQMHQIAMNLMTNAYHAIEPDSGEIRVNLQEVILAGEPWPGSTLSPGRYVLLSVGDTGRGIAPADLGRIFEPYFTTKAQGKGTGLGLAVVYGIVKEHGGDIRVASAPGKGSTFQVYLPLLDRPSDFKDEDKASKACPSGTERILVIDDEGTVAHLQRRMLESLGYRVSIYTDSLEGLNAFRREPERFDLVITDMTMPGMTGDRLAEQLLATRPDVPIILCTGFSERITPEKAEAIGIKGFLMKPVAKVQLAEMVRKVLDSARESR